MPGLATKEDVSNAKLQVILAWGSTLVSIVVAASVVIARVWPT